MGTFYQINKSSFQAWTAALEQRQEYIQSLKDSGEYAEATQAKYYLRARCCSGCGAPTMHYLCDYCGSPS